MIFKKKSDGLWHGFYKHNGQSITAAHANLIECIYRMGSQLNTLKGAPNE